MHSRQLVGNVRRFVETSDHLSETIRPFVRALASTDFFFYLCK